MTDSLQFIADTVFVENKSLIDIVREVDGFYMNAWDVYTVGLIAVLSFFGVVFPIIVGFYTNYINTGTIRKIEKDLEDYKKRMDALSELLEKYRDALEILKRQQDKDGERGAAAMANNPPK